MMFLKKKKAGGNALLFSAVKQKLASVLENHSALMGQCDN